MAPRDDCDAGVVLRCDDAEYGVELRCCAWAEAEKEPLGAGDAGGVLEEAEEEKEGARAEAWKRPLGAGREVVSWVVWAEEDEEPLDVGAAGKDGVGEGTGNADGARGTEGEDKGATEGLGNIGGVGRGWLHSSSRRSASAASSCSRAENLRFLRPAIPPGMEDRREGS